MSLLKDNRNSTILVPIRHDNRGGLVYHGGQEWIADLFLASVLLALLFLMILSIYLVISKPAPPVVPETETQKGFISEYAACRSIPASENKLAVGAVSNIESAIRACG